MRPRLDDCIAHAVLARLLLTGSRSPRQVKERQLQVFVRDNNVDQALRVLKKKMQREGVFREMKRRRFYEKPSEQSAREKSEAVRRSRKLARKKAIFDGSIAAPRKKPGLDANGKPKSAERGRPPTRR
jgi:small subunit ribosomal protein S21